MKTEIKNLPLDLLTYDPLNPRLPTSIDGNDEKAVISWMLDNENLIELMLSIAEKGYFEAEPIWVVPSGTKEGKFEVVEGNRRLTAVKLLNNPDLATSRRNTIDNIIRDAKVFPKEIASIIFSSREEVEVYLGYRHITGVQNWDSLAKARYLKHMLKSLEVTDMKDAYRTLAKLIGSRADFVEQLLTGLKVYETIENNSFFGIKDLSETSAQFGTLYTALNSPNIAYFIGIDEDVTTFSVEEINIDHLAEFSKWLYEKNSEGKTRIGESRNLKLLSKVLDSDSALKAFREGKPLADAVLLTNQPLEIYQESIQKAESFLKIALDYVYLIQELESKDVEHTRQLMELGRTLYGAIRHKFEDFEDSKIYEPKAAKGNS